MEIAKDGICVVVLDSLTDAPLREEELIGIQPIDTGKGWRYYQTYISFSTIPSSYIYVGNTAPVITRFIKMYSNNWPNGQEQINMKWWSEIPKEEREAFNKYMFARIPVVIGRKELVKNQRYLDDEILAEISNYSDLDILPCLDSVQIGKAYDGLFSYLQKRHYITSLNMWNHHQETLDLRETLFISVQLDISGLHTLYLNDRTKSLWLFGKAEPDLEIYAKNNGFGIYFWYKVKNNIVSNFGLREIEDVALSDIYEIDMEQVVDQFPEIRKLNLVGNPGNIRNLGALGKVKSLEELLINDLFGFTSEDLVPLLGLEKLNLFWMTGVPEEAGKYARKAFKGKVYSLSISKLRKPEWIVENSNNPFRSWDGDEGIPAGAFRKATLIYNHLKTDLDAAAEMNDVLLAVTKYVEAFNKLDKKHENFIETTLAEDIYLALVDLLESIGADGKSVWKEDALAVFDKKRDW